MAARELHPHARSGTSSILPTLGVVTLLLLGIAGLLAATDVSPLVLVVAVVALNTVALQIVRRAVSSRSSR
jgi:hypothetical protein